MSVLSLKSLETAESHPKNNHIGKPLGESTLTRIKNCTKEVVPIALGMAGLEAVISFSFSSLDGLFFIISTLASGTSIYVLSR